MDVVKVQEKVWKMTEEGKEEQGNGSYAGVGLQNVDGIDIPNALERAEARGVPLR